MKKRKSGDSIVTIPITLTISMVIIISFMVFILNICTTYIWYEKMQSISLKYLYILEEYGYLTEKEQENLKYDLKNAGFKQKNIEIKCTDVEKEYGELVFIDIRYKYDLNVISIFSKESNIIPNEMKIYKSTYSKK